MGLSRNARKKLGLEKGETRKSVTYVTPLPENLNDKAMEQHADKIRKLNQIFKDKGYRMVCKDDPIKRPAIHRLAVYLNRISVADTAYFWNNWDLDPVCHFAYEIAKFFEVPIEFENPEDKKLAEEEYAQEEK